MLCCVCILWVLYFIARHAHYRWDVCDRLRLRRAHACRTYRAWHAHASLHVVGACRTRRHCLLVLPFSAKSPCDTLGESYIDKARCCWCMSHQETLSLSAAFWCEVTMWHPRQIVYRQSTMLLVYVAPRDIIS